MTAIFCKHCGATLVPESKFCSNCGQATPSHTTTKATDYVDLKPQPPPKSKNRVIRVLSATRTLVVAWIWMFVIILVALALDSSGVTAPHTPAGQAIAVIALISIVFVFLTVAVSAIQSYRQPRQEPKTPSEIALRQEAEKNREKIILATAIIGAIILGIFLFFTFVHIDLIFTLTPTTTP